MCVQRYYGIQDGRFFVLLSLTEAESMRAAIHWINSHEQGAGAVLGVASSDAAVALRILPAGLVCDATASFSAGRPYQSVMAVQCARFIDSECDFTPRCVSLLQRCLASNTTEQRTAFFYEIRACRRRPQTAVQDTAVGRVLCREDELLVLHQRAVATRILLVLQNHDMCVADAFAMFDANRDGSLSAEELYDGLNCLGLRMTPAELRDLIVLFDTDQNGSVSLEEFKAALHVPGLQEDLAPRISNEPAPAGPPPAIATGGGGVGVSAGVSGAAVLVDGGENEWAVHAPQVYAPPSAKPTGSIDQGMAPMPAIPPTTLELMFAKLQGAVSKVGIVAASVCAPANA